LHDQRGTETLDEVHFCSPIDPVRHVFLMKRVEASEGIVFVVVVVVIVAVRDKNQRRPLRSLSS
jgi:hypothetical protein